MGGETLTRRSLWSWSPSSSSPRILVGEASTKAFNTERKPGAVISTFRVLTSRFKPGLEVWREGVRGVMKFKICRVKNEAIC